MVFRLKPLIADDEFEWLFEVYEWLLGSFGGWDDFEQSQLVLPNSEFFPASSYTTPEEIAAYLFVLTKQHARMGDWQFELLPQADTSDRAEVFQSAAVGMHETSGAAGTFSVSASGLPLITYNPQQLHNRPSFIATMAHEMSHALMHTTAEPAPGGFEAEEFATDVCATFLGFGVFMANSAFNFSQFQDGIMAGWSASRTGYLDERMHAASLAIFIALLEINPKDATPHLKLNPRSYLKKSLKLINKNWSDRIRKLRKIEAPPKETAGESKPA